MTEMEEATQPAPKEPEPYLMIRLLELTNFKSYANTIKIGPFDRHMTSVVGPNGSGKSNVIDAMLFVFGFKANKCARASTPFASASAPARSHPRSPSPRHKSRRLAAATAYLPPTLSHFILFPTRRMRQGKVSDLIHSSETYPDLQFARVAVHFQKVLDQPNGDYEVVPGSEFTVTREARKDNTSKYWINSPDINRKGGDKVSNFKEVTTYLQQHGIDLDTTASSSSRARSSRSP